jgi:hypothetical protein
MQAVELLADPGGVVVPADLGQLAVEDADLDVMATRLEPTEEKADARRQFIGRRLPGLERTRDELGNDLGRDLRGELVGGERDPAAGEAVGLLEREDRAESRSATAVCWSGRLTAIGLGRTSARSAGMFHGLKRFSIR